ncbi:Stage II sporulation protein E (SpoIIE) [Eubacterium ruminantium]|nr:Stage II sporulation protein E (SpoIIE) [Eubacterium ruminantium]
MKIIRKIRSNLYATIIGSFILMMALIAVIIEYVGYYAFTSSFTKEYKESVSKAAKVAEKVVTGHMFSYFLGAGGEVIENYYKYAGDDTIDPFSEYEYTGEPFYKRFFRKIDVPLEKVKYKTIYSEIDRDYYLTDDDYYDAIANHTRWICDCHMMVRKDLLQLCNDQKMSVMYVIIPDSDYKHYTCIFNCPSEESGYTPWEFGKRIETPSEEYEKAYRNIYENGSQSEVVIRTDNLNGGSPHITAMIPIYDTNGITVKKGEIVGLLCVQRTMEELAASRKLFIQGVTGITVMAIVIMGLIISRFISRQIVNPIRKISKEAERFATENKKGDNPLGYNVSSVEDISSLAVAIDKMEADTIKNIDDITNFTRDQERIGTELSLAADIQRGLLPVITQNILDRKEFSIAASMEPAKAVGGDFYDFFMIDDTHIALVMADVSDKGVGAAFFMAISKTLIKSRAGLGGTPSEILAYVDKLIYEKNTAGMFVTVWLGIIDLETGHVQACNAGHDHPAILGNSKEYVIKKTVHGSPIAFLPGMEFPGHEFELRPGDSIFLYTDGIVDAKRGDGERFGTERMLRTLNRYKDVDNDTLLKGIKREIKDFVCEEPQFDDMTMLSFTFLGKKK